MKKTILILLFMATIFPFVYGVNLGENYLSTKIVLSPIKEATVSSLVDSFIDRYNFKVGEEFTKGDILVQLDNRLYKQSKIKADADFTATEAAYSYSDSIYKHDIKLCQKDAIGSQELEKSKLDTITEFGKKEQAKANLTISEIKLDACSIKAPFSGRIIVKDLNEYDFVRTGQPILQIIDDNKLLAVMHLASSDFKKYKLGKKLKFKIDETQENITGSVYEIAGSINPGSRSFELKALIDNKDKKLRAGMSGVLVY